MGQGVGGAEFRSIPWEIRQKAQEQAESIERGISWQKHEGKLISGVEAQRLQKEFERKLETGEIFEEGGKYYERIPQEVITPELTQVQIPPGIQKIIQPERTVLTQYIEKPRYTLPEFQFRDIPQKATIGAEPQMVEVLGKPKTFAEFTLLDVPLGVGTFTGKVAKKITPKFEIVSPEIEVYQTATIGAEIPKFEQKIYQAPELSEEIGKLGGTVVAYSLIPSEVLLVGGGYLALQKDLPVEKRIEAGALAGFGALGVAGKTIRFFKEPIIKELPKVKPTYETTEIVQPFIKEGVEKQAVTFKLIRDTPAQYGVETTRFAESFIGKGLKRFAEFETEMGLTGAIGQRAEKLLIPKPRKIQIQKPRTDITWTPEPLIVEKGIIKEPAHIVAMKVGKKPTFVTAYGITGVTEKITPEMFKQLSKTQKYVVQRTIESELGRPIPLKEIERFIPKKGIEIARGQLVAERLFRINPRKKEVRIFEPKFTRAETISFIKEVPREAEVKVFKTITGVKDITKPFARAIGGIPVIRGVTFIKPPRDITPPSSYLIPKKVSPMTKEIPKTDLTGLSTLAAKVLPKPTQSKIPKPKPLMKPKLKPTTGISMVGPFQIPKGEWYGKRVIVKGPEEIEYIGKKDTFQIIEPTKVIPKVYPILIGEPKQIQVTEPIIKEIQERVIVPKVIPKTIDLTKLIPKEKVIQKLVPKLVPKTKMAQETKKSIVSRIIPKLLRSPPKPPRKEIKVPPPYPPTEPKKPEYIKRLKKKPELAIPFVRRYGKFKPITKKPIPKKKAIKIGKARLRETLAATLQLRKPSGEVIPIGKETFEFRKSKEGVSLVQRKEQRLATIPERLEIIKLRRGIKLT